jgi:hypothetical protein
MKRAKLYFVNVGFCIVYILNKWIQLQYGGKHYYNLGAFCLNKPGRTLGNMLLEGANYIQDSPKLFFKIEQYHARKMCFKKYFIHRLKNGMEN